jgi:rhamnulokinase
MHYVAFDLGAGSGRVMLGTLQDQKIILEEIHRFPDSSVTIDRSHYWQILNIFSELQAGLQKIADRGIQPRSISCDSWGVDYVLVKEPNPMVSPPFQYRDSRSNGWEKKLDASIGLKNIYQETGIQSMFFNTIYQMSAHQAADPATLAFADFFLGIGDYINYLFSGVARMEVSLASTTALYNPRQRAWSCDLINKLNLPADIFPEITASGSVLGPLRAPLTGMEATQVVASCSHDTAAAVAAVPATEDDKPWAFLSSGTWSLLGVELAAPLINDQSAELNYTNEVGFGHTIRFLKNISGMFIIQELKSEWQAQGITYEFDAITHMAAAAPPFSFFIDPNHECFATAGNMEEKIRQFCQQTGQEMPTDHGTILRGVFESLALFYRTTLQKLEQVTNQKFERLHIVGGGSKNALLNQFSANALNIEVQAGPDEATAVGNILIQAIAMGDLKGLPELRTIVAHSFETVSFHPDDSKQWEQAYGRFVNICR